MALSLNGNWLYGDHNGLLGECTVPGLVLDPAQSHNVWLRRKVVLPAQPFNRLLLVLKGARFRPQVFVNGTRVSAAEGGMAFTRHLFAHPDCVPGAEIELEVRLCGLDEMPLTDASRIPEADHWRSNLSSCLWDDVLLYPIGEAAITRIVPHADPCGVTAIIDTDAPCKLNVRLHDANGAKIGSVWCDAQAGQNEVRLPCKLNEWSPDTPSVYSLTAVTEDGISQMKVNCGLSEFRVKDPAFMLNDRPIRLRGTSVVWHRFCRDPEARTLAFDEGWFEDNIILRLKNAGANLLRFHLGAPMERMLDLCDRHGLCVQLEWLFFHGMKACEESLIIQWRELLTLAACHPCVSIIQLWNETEGPELETAMNALKVLDKEFPHAVIAHRDVVHVHKYWWSLFENLNLSYDSLADIPGAAMVDEFGGNYLDGDLNVGGYPEAELAFARFLGNDHTPEERDELQALANARVGEYWRRIGVAGYATFAALSSPEDGNHHFLGALKDGNPKSVWQACSALYAPIAACLELWDRAFEHGQTAQANVWLFNDTYQDAEIRWQTSVIDEDGVSVNGDVQCHKVAACSHLIVPVTFTLPHHGSRAVVQVAVLDELHPVSAWPVRLHHISVPESLKGQTFAMLSDEPELRAFALEYGMVEDENAPRVLLGGQDALAHMHTDAAFRTQLEKKMRSGSSMLLCEIGPRLLGEGYIEDRSQIRLDGNTLLECEQSWQYRLPFDLTVRFDALAEAESCCHPPMGLRKFDFLNRGALQLSNGYRGAINAPAVAMELESSDRQGILEQWKRRGAPEDMLLNCPDCTAYHLEGFYAFAETASQDTADALRERVRFLVADAPSLEKRIDPEAEIEVIQLGRLLSNAPVLSSVSAPQPLVVCGRDLNQVVVCEFKPEADCGKLIISQLLTGGRLMAAYSQPGLYGARRDPEMIQMMLSLLDRVLGC